MFRFLLAVFALFTYSASWAQFTLTGKVKSQLTGEPVSFAVLSLSGNNGNTTIPLTIAEDGSFTQSGITAGTYFIRAMASGYKPYEAQLVINADRAAEVILVPMMVVTDELTVSAIRARKDAPTVYTGLSRKDIAKENYGQDIPYLLNMTPSVVVNSDAGAGVGYTDIRIRGVDNTRINVTVNGIPINDAESQGTFLVNMPDLATSVQQMQVQRGVGTSTNGPAAFGASINMQTLGVQPKPYAELTNAYGSFNTLKNNIQFGTGLLNSKWAIDGRLSSITSDGYIDRATSDLKSYYISVGRYGEKSLLKFVHFSGKEKTYQAWNGVPEDKLKTDRTYNEFTYPNQTDNYKQSHYQLFYNISPTPKLFVNTALHFTHGEGYYEEYKENDDFANYNLPNVIIGGDTITQTNLVRQRWLNNDFGGFVASLNYKFSSRTDFTLGGGANRYFGNHYGIVTWAQYASTSTNLDRYYDDDAQKTDWNIYGKLNHQFGKLRALLDLQVRHIDYSFLGYNLFLQNIQQDVHYLFFNPKAGLVYDINATDNIYASYGRASREPTRTDFTETSLQSRPKEETMDDVEAGYRITRKRWGLQANLFWMQYKDQLILTGQINDVGSYTHTNTPESFRRGIELSASVTITAKLQVSGNLMLSQNKIKSFTEYVDDYDGGPQRTFNYSNTDLAASPNTVAGARLHYIFLPNLTGDIYFKYVSKQYLDNTQSDARSIDAYNLVDLGFNYNLPLKKGWLSYINAGVKLNNLANAMYVSKGYTYSGFSGGVRGDYNYYYAQAGFNFLAQVSLGF